MPGPENTDDRELGELCKQLGDKYRVVKLLGRGGFGSVYLVEITAGMVGERLALKVIPSHLSSDERFHAQFINEIRIAMRLVDKYIIQIRDVGTTLDGHLYYTMDYSPGVTLKDVLGTEGRLEPGRAALLVLRVLRALQTAHGQGVIHRDLKPANLMVEGRGGTETIRVLDFGIATAVQNQPTLEAGKFVGSPHYMPPEQFVGAQLGFGSDLYAVGVVLYECVTGQRPYHGSTPQEVYDDLKSRAAVPPQEFNSALKDYPGLSEIIMRALERNPERRYQSAKQFFSELNDVIDRKRRAEQAQAPASATAPSAAPTTGTAPSPTAAPDQAVSPAQAVSASAATEAAVQTAPPRVPRGARRRSVTRRRRNPVGSAIVTLAAIGATVILALVIRDKLMNSSEDERDPARERPGVSSKPDTGAQDETVVVEPVRRPKPPEKEPVDEEKSTREKIAEYLASARAAFDQKKWFQVREHANDVIRINHQTAEAYRLRGLAELDLELWSDAAGSLRMAIDYGLTEAQLPGSLSEPPKPALFIALADAILKSSPGDTYAAKDVLGEALTRYPSAPDATARLATILDAEGSEAEIVQLLRRVRRRVEHPTIDALYQKWLVELPEKRRAAREAAVASATEAFRRGDFKSVVDAGDPVFQTDKGAELGFMLAASHRELGNFQQSLGVLGELAPAVRDDSASIVLVAILFAQTHLEAYERAEKKDAGLLAKCRMNVESALAVLDEGAKLDPKLRARALTYRARCAAYDGNLVQVDMDVKFARNADDRDPELALHQGRTYFVLGQRTKEEAAFRRAIARIADYERASGSGNDPMPDYLKGLSYLSLGRNKSDFRNASNHFAAAVSRGMKTPELYKAWAEAKYHTGDLRSTARFYRESFNLRPDIETCYWAAKYFKEAGLTGSARDVLDAGIQRFFEDPAANKLKDLRREL